MIVKMKFVSIMGKTNDIDRVINKYISKYEIQFENALTEIASEKHIRPLEGINEYAKYIKETETLVNIVNYDNINSVNNLDMSGKKAIEIIKNFSVQISNMSQKKDELIEQKQKLQNLKQQVEPFMNLNFKIEKLLNFEFIKFRFGKMPRDSYKKFETYINELDVFFVPSTIESDYVWGIYFTTEQQRKNVDPMFASLHFERIHISDELKGTPSEAYSDLSQKILKADDEINKITVQQSKEIENHKEEIISAYNKIVTLNDNFSIKKYAAQMKGSVVDAYILVGWITEEDAKKLGEELKDDKEVVYVVEDEKSGVRSRPPTKLKNPKIFRSFEMFTKMYGMPSYNEFDPTIFVALTYAFIFGMMYGDVGQGLVLAIGGFVLYKLKNISLAAIISLAGISSTVFGFAYGSVFGFEEAIPTMWLKPMEDTNTILIVSVSFGVILILVAMIINIVNKINQNKIGEALFGTNGVSGLVFYTTALVAAICTILGKTFLATWVLIILIGIPFLFTAFKEPMIRYMKHKKNLIHGKKGQYFMETFFEMFEVLLSYITNTISFVRIGAFALSHAGMMSIVHMLASGTNEGVNIIILILGNVLVMTMEGLIVGIQVLRLEYYEMFSRFYEADGIEFKPFKTIDNN